MAVVSLEMYVETMQNPLYYYYYYYYYYALEPLFQESHPPTIRLVVQCKLALSRVLV
jgi:hypothetical protein